MPTAANPTRARQGANYLLGLLLLGVPVSCAMNHSDRHTPASPADRFVGHAAPDFQLRDLHGHVVRLSSLRGQVVLLDFWATWCGPCRQEIPILEQLAQQFAKQNVLVLGINAEEAEEVVRSFAAKNKLSYPVLLTSGDRNPMQAYDVRGLPTVALIDKEGIIAAYRVGVSGETSAFLHDDLRHVLSANYKAPRAKVLAAMPLSTAGTAGLPTAQAPDPNWCPQTADELVARGFRRLLFQQNAEALRDADDALKLHPDWFLAEFLQAHAAYQEKNFQTAIQGFDKVISQKPDWPQAYLYRALSYSHSGQQPRALPDYQTALRLNPYLASAYYELGRAYLELGQFEPAKANLDKALELEPQFLPARENRAKLFIKQNQWPAAMNELTIILGLNPQDQWAKDNREVLQQKITGVPLLSPAPQDPSLPGPQLVSPADQTVLNIYPRHTRCQWEAVPGAASYLLEWDYSYNDVWAAELHKHDAKIPVKGTEGSFDFVGAQPGRWRVWSVKANGDLGSPSEWRTFRYLQ